MNADLSASPRSRAERWREIVKIAWPLVIANGFWNLQLTIDRVYLGRHSTESLAAAMAVMGVFWVPMALIQQTAAYVTTFVAQYYGAERYDRIGPSVWQSLYLSVAGGLLMLLMIPGTEMLFRWIGHSPSVQPLEVDYFNALSHSALPTALVAAASGFFTGLGHTRVIMWINCVGLIANVILDYIMIFGHFGCPALGIAGAGYATALATWASAFFGLYLVFKRKHDRDYGLLTGWRFDADLTKRFLRYGLPSGLQWALEGLAFTIFLIIVGRMSNGDAALAASGIAVTVMLMSILPALGVAQAVMVLVGQHLGEKNPAEAESATWSGLQVAIMYILTMGLTFAVFPEFYLNWFRNAENAPLWGEVSAIVPILLLYVAAFTNFDSMNLVFSFALKGAGDTRFVTMVALLIPWPLMVLPTWFVKDWNGAVYWAWGAASCYIVSQAFIFLWRFKGGKWKSMSVIQ